MAKHMEDGGMDPSVQEGGQNWQRELPTHKGDTAVRVCFLVLSADHDRYTQLRNDTSEVDRELENGPCRIKRNM